MVDKSVTRKRAQAAEGEAVEILQRVGVADVFETRDPGNILNDPLAAYTRQMELMNALARAIGTAVETNHKERIGKLERKVEKLVAERVPEKSKAATAKKQPR